MTTKPPLLIKKKQKEKGAKEKLEELKHYLEEISPVYLPNFYHFTNAHFELQNFPLSYKKNTISEKKFLSLSIIFRKQYKVLYKSRKRLLLITKNECNIKKFISTYICPIQWQFPEMYNWESASKFVSDYLNLVPLLPTTEIPDVIYSATTTLRLQRGNCFEYCNLLCSFLIGVGYDAYIVCGYATRECCYMDQTRCLCPLLQKPISILPQINVKNLTKYTTKPIKTYRSKYDMTQIAKEIKETELQQIKEQKIEEEEIIENEKPPQDPLYGLRVHCWILIKAGQRDIKNDFFIESLTGIKVNIDTNMYLGIESLWNDKNYWVNKFCCIYGLKNLKFDLDSLEIWEPLLPKNEILLNKHLIQKGVSDDDDIVSLKYEEKMNMPLSWVKNLKIDIKAFEKRFPGSQKITNYNRVQYFQYSPYYCISGLVGRLKIYEDRKYTKLLEIHEFLKNREDKHYKTIIKDGWVTEYFKEGNPFYLKEHSYLKIAPSKENKREILFYENTRVDGLYKKVESQTSIEEFYKNRNDYLHYMYAEFEPRLEDEEDIDCYRQIVKIIKKYHRNPLKKADDDIMELNYMLSDDKISIIYHLNENGIISSTREYNKPQPSTDGRNIIHLYPDTHSFFAANNTTKIKTNLEAYELLRELMTTEKITIDDVHWSENDTKTILKGRSESKKKDKITITLYDTIRNFEAKRLHKLIDQEYQQGLNAKEELLDFLNPYFAQQNISEVTTKEQAFIIRESCLYDLKQRLISQANLIKNRFEEETDMLQKKQTWYYQNKMVLSLEEENKYLAYCGDAVSLLDTLESLLTRHKQTAPHKYMELERKIQRDPRLAPFM